MQFWSGLSVVARRDLLRIDKQTLFEQVRKNLYCSRCHGLLVEGFSQIILYGKSLQAGMVGTKNVAGPTGRHMTENGHSAAVAAGFSDDSRDPSVHPWGGLAATRDSMLTVLDCFLDGMPLEVLQNVPPTFHYFIHKLLGSQTCRASEVAFRACIDCKATVFSYCQLLYQLDSLRVLVCNFKPRTVEYVSTVIVTRTSCLTSC